MNSDICIEEALNEDDACYIDLRSEKEFAEDTIPGAVNIPLFNNEEREKIGTIYKQVSVEEAKLLGLEIAGKKLKQIYQQAKECTRGKKGIVFCWRGGMRSQFAASVLNSMGLRVKRITGGYKAYRKLVYQYLYETELPYDSVVLHGLTGVGKTRILYRLQEMGVPVIDLETLAAHKGSVYGKINMPSSPSQKMFESKIMEQLTLYEKKKYFVVECEGRRLGKLYVPPKIIEKITTGHKILLYADLNTRVKRIIEDYTNGPNKNIKELQDATSRLVKYLGGKKAEELNALLEQEQFEEVFSYLLEKYYDPLYKYPQQPDNNYDYCVNCEDLDLAAEKIYQYLQERYGM